MSLNDSAQISLSTSNAKAGYGTLLDETNELLARVGISAKKISSLGELSRVSSSMFVAVYESLFRTRLDDIIRNPQTREEYTFNVQQVINELSEQIQIDLKHISGQDIADGDIRSISNLLHIFARIFNVTSYDGNQQDKISDSISTHESAFQELMTGGTGATGNGTGVTVGHHMARHDVAMIDSQSHSHSHSYSGDSSATAGSPLHLPLHHFKDNEQLTISSIDKTDQEEINKVIQHKNKTLALEYKQEAAQRRREAYQTTKGKIRLTQGRKKEFRTREIQHQRWSNDFIRQQNAVRIRSKSQDHLLLRKVYQGLVRKMHQWELEETSQTREKTSLIKEDLNWKIQSLESMLAERVEVFKRKEVERIAEEKQAQIIHKQMTNELKKCLMEKHRKFLDKQALVHIQHQDQSFLKRHESFNDLIAILSADKWENTLRGSYPSAMQPNAFLFQAATANARNSIATAKQTNQQYSQLKSLHTAHNQHFRKIYPQTLSSSGGSNSHSNNGATSRSRSSGRNGSNSGSRRSLSSSAVGRGASSSVTAAGLMNMTGRHGFHVPIRYISPTKKAALKSANF